MKQGNSVSYPPELSFVYCLYIWFVMSPISITKFCNGIVLCRCVCMMHIAGKMLLLIFLVFQDRRWKDARSPVFEAMMRDGMVIMRNCVSNWRLQITLKWLWNSYEHRRSTASGYSKILPSFGNLKFTRLTCIQTASSKLPYSWKATVVMKSQYYPRNRTSSLRFSTKVNGAGRNDTKTNSRDADSIQLLTCKETRGDWGSNRGVNRFCFVVVSSRLNYWLTNRGTCDRV